MEHASYQARSGEASTAQGSPPRMLVTKATIVHNITPTAMRWGYAMLTDNDKAKIDANENSNKQ